MDKLVSVVIPCFNEEERILPVLNSLKQSKSCGEIIVVDDGSNKTTKDILIAVKGIKLITHPKNLGKAQALKTGILQAKYDVIVFIDADLVNLTPDHINALIEPVINSDCDLTLSDRPEESFYTVFSGFNIAYTGERCVRRQLLLQHLDIFDNPGYLIESSMNRIFFKNYRVKKVPFPEVGQISKSKKYGIVKGLYLDAKMFFQIIQFSGLKELIFQLSFAKRLPGYPQ
ncbi:MAG: glycosyltransferase family 2 protein [Candidatus Shapirobacteria bacterium]|jgi:glycosyltransferase involved in cell wall biosynthesis